MRLAVLAIFFLSGMTGLIYEIVWTKMMSLTIGSTVWSLTTVLVAFMGGLAAGSYIAGRLGERIKRPLLVYGVLEALIGLYAICVPFLINLTEPVFAFLYNNYYGSFITFSLFRFLVCALILFVPTMFMGATLPLLSKFLVRSSSRVGSGAGALYAINTLGAVAGSLVAGFVLLPTFGQWRSILLAASLNFAIAVVAVAMHKFWNKAREAPEQATAESVEKDGAPKGLQKLSTVALVCLIAYASSGFAAMVYQIAWTRALALSLGSSVYAFSIIVSAFILGLALGSVVASIFVERFKRRLLVFAIIELLIAFSAVAAIPIIGKLPLWSVSLVTNYSSSYSQLLALQFGIVFLIILVPTMLMGMCFPVASGIYAKERGLVARGVGGIYSANTFGAILGSFVGGFVFLVWFGMEKSIIYGSWINLGAAGLLFIFAVKFSRVLRVGVGAVVFLLSALLVNQVPEWDEAVMSSGPMSYAGFHKKISENERISLEEVLKRDEILLFKEGPNITLSVAKTDAGTIFLRVNGKTDASTGRDMNTQILLGQLPMLLHENPRDVFVLGLASGVTLGSVALHPIQKAVCLEIAKYTREAYNFFKHVNNDPLADNRVNLIIGDARTNLKLSNDTYDVIISEPSNPWIAGISTLFTVEFFELVEKRLNPGGIVCIWVHAYNMNGEDFKLIINTFRKVFPSATMWEALRGGDYLLIARKPPGSLLIDVALIERKLKDPKIMKDLSRAGASTTATLLSHFIMGEKKMALVIKGPEIHTDDRLSLEYNAPKNLFKDYYKDIYKNILRHYEKPTDYIYSSEGKVSEELIEEMERLSEARKLAHKAKLEQMAQRPYNAIGLYEKVLKINPNDFMAREEAFKIYSEAGTRMAARGRYEDALPLLESASRLKPGNPLIVAQIGSVFFEMGLLEQAEDKLISALRMRSRLSNANYYLGLVYRAKGENERALKHIDIAIETNPWIRGAWVTKALIFKQRGERDRAIKTLNDAIEFDKKSAIAFFELGKIYKEDPDTAAKGEQYIRKAFQIEPEMEAVLKGLQ